MLKDVGGCFACGRENPDGLRLDIRKTKDGVEVEYAFPERYTGWQEMVHGGIIATVLDELLAWACNNVYNNTVTAEMAVRFRRPLKVGQRFRGFGRVAGIKGRLVNAESWLVDSEDRIVAEATGKMMIVPPVTEKRKAK